MSGDRDQARTDAQEARADDHNDAWMYTTRLDDDAAEDLYERRHYA